MRQRVKIFISYAHENRKQAAALALSLTQSGHKVFFDKEDLPVGKTFDQRIQSEIGKSDLLIFLITPQSVPKGRYTRTELGFAQQKWPNPNGRILPVMASPTPLDDIPIYLKGVTIMDPKGSLVAEVSAAVGEMRVVRKRLVSVAAVMSIFILSIGVIWGPDLARDTSAIWRAAASPDSIPLNSRTDAQLQGQIDALAGSLEVFLSNLPDTEEQNTPWEVAQASVALSKTNRQIAGAGPAYDLSKDHVAAFFGRNLRALSRTNSTRFIVQKNAVNAAGLQPSDPVPHLVALESRIKEAAHVASSSWVLMAHAAYGRAPPPELFDFIIDMQHREGWWPIYAGVDADDDNASAYVTVTASWALLETLQNGRLTPAQRTAAANALEKAIQWIGDSNQRGSALWRPYPERSAGGPSISVSGNAMFLLHETNKRLGIPRSLEIRDRFWARDLTMDVPDDDGYEQSQDKILDPHGALIGQDQTRYWLFPWKVAGSAAAYENSTVFQRAKIIKWLEAAIEQHDPSETVKDRQWLEAEILLSLLYLQEKSIQLESAANE